MPRFTVKDLLRATTLIAIGVGAVALVHHYGRTMPPGWLKWAGLAGEGGIVLIGAGLFLPFKRPWTGAPIALILQIVVAWFILPVVY